MCYIKYDTILFYVFIKSVFANVFQYRLFFELNVFEVYTSKNNKSNNLLYVKYETKM